MTDPAVHDQGAPSGAPPGGAGGPKAGAGGSHKRDEAQPGTHPAPGESTPAVWEALDLALDRLPRYFSVIEQGPNGWSPGEGDGPTMLACVGVADVREMLRRELLA